MKSIRKLILVSFVAALAMMPVSGLAKGGGGGGGGHGGGFGRNNNSSSTKNNKNSQNQNNQSNQDKTVAKLDINTATASQLATLPGITDDLAGKIVEGRPYSSPSDLKSKKILTTTQYNAIKDRVTASKQPKSTPAKPPKNSSSESFE